MSTHLFRILTVVALAVFLILSCEESSPEEQDTIPPEVIITSPQNGASIFEIVTITCMATDNGTIEQVELWIDGVASGIIDNSEPYALTWNTTSYADSSTHTVIVRATDKAGNEKDSEPISVLIDNSNSFPVAIDITSIALNGDSLIIEWVESEDSDFSVYTLERSNSYNIIDSEVIYTSQERDIVSFIDAGIDPTIVYYYRVSVSDSLGYQTEGQVSSSPRDPLPERPSFKSITYDQTNHSFVIEWFINPDGDFQFYSLEEDVTFDFSNPTTIFTSSARNDTTYFREGVQENQQFYYRVIVSDRWDQQRASEVIGGSSFLKIAFISYNQVATVNTNGSDGSIIDNNTARDISWSNNGEWIIYSSASDKIRRVRGSGTGAELIFSSENRRISLPTFTLGDERIYFSWYYNSGSDVIVSMNLDATELIEHWVAPGNIQNFDLSSNGLMVVIGVWIDEPKIYVGNSDGTNIQNIGFLGRDPSWSPNSDEIVYSDHETRNIFKYSIDTQDTTQLTYNAGNFRTPKWSPDGSRITYERNGGIGVGVVNADGTNELILTGLPDAANSPEWDNTGANIVCFSNNDIYIVEISSGMVTQLTDGLDAEYPVFQPQFPPIP